jgi:hypothetical protein
MVYDMIPGQQDPVEIWDLLKMFFLNIPVDNPLLGESKKGICLILGVPKKANP